MEYLDYEVIPDGGPGISGGEWKRAVLDIVETLVLSLILFFGINALTARIRVESISMQPNLYAGDMVLVNRLAYRFGQPQRGEIIVFKYPPEPTQTPYIKRIIGLPGDRIQIANGQVIVNDQVLVESYISVTTSRGGEWVVPEQSLFVMGDNRNNSSDSRAWGMVPYDNIIGKALFIYWPLDHTGALTHAIAVAAPSVETPLPYPP